MIVAEEDAGGRRRHNLVIRRPKFDQFSTYRDHLVVFASVMIISILYRIRGDYLFVSCFAVALGVLLFLPRQFFPDLDWGGRLDAWKPGLIVLLWFLYGTVYSAPESVLWPNWLGWTMSMLTAAVSIASYLRMDLSMLDHYKYALCGQIAIALIFPSQDTCPLLSPITHMVLRVFYFYIIYMMNDLRIHCYRFNKYCEVDDVLVTLQSIWLLFSWYPAVMIIGSGQFIWLLFVVVKEATTISTKKNDGSSRTDRTQFTAEDGGFSGGVSVHIMDQV